MHTIEPHFNWRNLYIASEDEKSPFFGRLYSEFEFTHSIYNHLIHPQWDYIGSPTLFVKILYVNYEDACCIIELIGEWNDCLHNDVMHLKRNVIDSLLGEGISKFILIGENVLIFHNSDDCYYEEWCGEVENGWIALVNFRTHVLNDMRSIGLHQYFIIEDELNGFNWRSFNPMGLFQVIDRLTGRKEITAEIL